MSFIYRLDRRWKVKGRGYGGTIIKKKIMK